MAAVVLSHIVNRITLSRGIFKSPAVWLVASSVALSCKLSQNSKMLQEKLNYCIPATTVRMNTVRIHTCYSNTDMFLKRHANTTVGFSPKQKLSSKPLVFFTAVMHQSIPAAPMPPPPPPRAKPRALAFFSLGWQIPRGWGHLSYQMPRGWDEGRGQMPRPRDCTSPINTAAVFIHCTIMPLSALNV